MPLRVNCNTSEKKELELVPGIGPAMSKKIVAHRKKNGRYKTHQDLLEVSGYSENLLKKTKRYLVFRHVDAELPGQKSASSRKRSASRAKNSGDLGDFINEASKMLIRKGFEELEERIGARKKSPSKRSSSKKPASKKNTSEKSEPLFRFPKFRIPRIKSPKRLTSRQIEWAAKQLKVEPAAMQAVIDVEASGSGFLKNGKPKILFEGHIFWRELKQHGIMPTSVRRRNEDILYPKWTREHYLSGAREYRRLERAVKIHEASAYASASWGLFQIMGFNYKLAGFSKLEDFIAAMHKSEVEHLKAFIHFIDDRKLIPALRRKNWAKFAYGYNGRDYKKNRYDEKLEHAYLRSLRKFR